jgi:hypothetical protein
MTRKVSIAILAVALCAMLLPTAVMAKKPVRRPHRAYAQGVLNLFTGVDEQIGVMTHGGRFSNSGGMTGETSSAGIATVANGDEIHWTAEWTLEPEMSPEVTEYTVNGTITIYDGTGRFEGASGIITSTWTTVVDWDTYLATYSYVATGWIEY